MLSYLENNLAVKTTSTTDLTSARELSNLEQSSCDISQKCLLEKKSVDLTFVSKASLDSQSLSMNLTHVRKSDHQVTKQSKAKLKAREKLRDKKFKWSIV